MNLGLAELGRCYCEGPQKAAKLSDSRNVNLSAFLHTPPTCRRERPGYDVLSLGTQACHTAAIHLQTVATCITPI
jgi:hypothetical protein